MALDVDNYQGVDTDEEDELKKPKLDYPAPVPPAAAVPAAIAPPETQPPAAPDTSYLAPKPVQPPPRPGALTAQDYAAAQPHGWRKALGALAVGAAGWHNPEAGKMAEQEVFEEPVQRMQQQRAGEQQAYDTELQRGIQQRAETRAEEAGQAENKLKGAQAENIQKQGALTPVTLSNGSTVYVPQKDAAKLIGTEETTQGKFDIEKSKETAAQMLQGGRPVSMDQLAAKATKEGDQATLDKIKGYKEEIAKAGKQEPGNFIPVNDAAGNTLGWADPKSRDFVALPDIGGASKAVGGNVEPMKPSGQTASRMQQGETVERAGDNLIQDIRSHRDKIGNLDAIVESAFLGTPLADPDQAYIATEIGSFAALNPAMHGFRGSQAMDEFKKLIGGIPKNPDALIASIKAIQRTAGALKPPTGGAGGTHKEGDTGTWKGKPVTWKGGKWQLQ